MTLDGYIPISIRWIDFKEVTLKKFYYAFVLIMLVGCSDDDNNEPAPEISEEQFIPGLWREDRQSQQGYTDYIEFTKSDAIHYTLDEYYGCYALSILPIIDFNDSSFTTVPGDQVIVTEYVYSEDALTLQNDGGGYGSYVRADADQPKLSQPCEDSGRQGFSEIIIELKNLPKDISLFESQESFIGDYIESQFYGPILVQLDMNANGIFDDGDWEIFPSLRLVADESIHSVKLEYLDVYVVKFSEPGTYRSLAFAEMSIENNAARIKLNNAIHAGLLDLNTHVPIRVFSVDPSRPFDIELDAFPNNGSFFTFEHGQVVVETPVPAGGYEEHAIVLVGFTSTNQ